MEPILEKENKLEQLLKNFDRVLVAFSGGVDSTYLLYKSLQVLGTTNLLAVTVHSELHPVDEVDQAEKTARLLGARHLVLALDLLADRQIRENDPERCYSCKKRIFTKMAELMVEKGYSAVFDGSNADDSSDHRPGLRALQELAIQSPLLKAGLTKAEIRNLSEKAGLPTWNKPANACLASRFPYGQEISAEGLRQVAESELFLRKLNLEGDLRVRSHGNLARIEVSKKADFDSILTERIKVVQKLREFGFLYVTIDLHGFESGSMNRPLDHLS